MENRHGHSVLSDGSNSKQKLAPALSLNCLAARMHTAQPVDASPSGGTARPAPLLTLQTPLHPKASPCAAISYFSLCTAPSPVPSPRDTCESWPSPSHLSPSGKATFAAWCNRIITWTALRETVTYQDNSIQSLEGKVVTDEISLSIICWQTQYIMAATQLNGLHSSSFK